LFVYRFETNEEAKSRSNLLCQSKKDYKQVSLDTTPSKCLPLALQVNWSGHGLHCSPLILKTFSAMPIHVKNICVGVKWQTDGWTTRNTMPQAPTDWWKH